MSVVDRLLAGEQVEVGELRTAVFRALFGDRLGVAVALTALVWVGVTWRLGFASNDQYTFANTVLAVADGHLHITDPVYGPASGSTPGTYLVDNRVYGRNYAIVFVSALWYVLLRVVALVADVRVLLTGLWSLALVGISTTAGTRIGRRRSGLTVGIGTASALFLASLSVAEPLSTYWLPLLALQLTTALSTAVLAVVCYRLVGRQYSQRLGLVAGLGAVLATPVGFWATLPKRHSVTAMLVVCTMYTLYRSRTAPDISWLRYRALTYVWPALLTWIHAPHGFILAVAVAVVDLPTARSNAHRELLTISAACGVALLPFFVTNVLISGSPIEPPRLLSPYEGDVLSANAGSGGEELGDGPGSDGDDVRFSSPVGALAQRFLASYAVFLEPSRLRQVFVHTGYVPGLRPGEDAAINLSVIASMPLLGALVAYPVLAGKRALGASNAFRSPSQWSPVRVLDTFTVVYVLLVLGLYLGSLPLHHMLTTRYLHTLFPVGIYWLVRLPAVRRSALDRTRVLVSSYGVTVAVLVPGYVVTIASGRLVLDESVQLYALFALAVATGAACWALAETVRERSVSVGAVVLGIAGGTMSVYLVVSGLTLFPETGEFLLPVSRIVSERFHYTRLYGSSPPFWDVTHFLFQPVVESVHVDELLARK